MHANKDHPNTITYVRVGDAVSFVFAIFRSRVPSAKFHGLI